MFHQFVLEYCVVLLDLLEAFLYILGYLLELIIKIWQSGIFIFISKSGESGPFFPNGNFMVSSIK
jgi:hypothetical protein